MNINELKINQRISFLTTAPNIFGSFQDVVFLGIVSPIVASKLGGNDIVADHANAYGTTRPETPDDPFQYTYVLVGRDNMSYAVGLPFIDQASIELVSDVEYQLRVRVGDLSEQDLRQILQQNGIELLSMYSV